MSADDQALDILMFMKQVDQLLGNIGHPLLACDLGPDLEQLHKLLHPLSQAGVPVPGDVGLEVHLVVLGVHHGERVILVLVITEPRAVGQLGEQHHATRTILRASVAVFLLYQGTIRTKNVGEVLVVLALGEFLDLNLRTCPPHRCLLIWR